MHAEGADGTREVLGLPLRGEGAHLDGHWS